MSKNVTLGYLGYKFQQELINQIVHPANKKFSERIIDIIHAKYFDNEYFRLIIVTIKDYYDRFEKIPEWDTLETVLKLEIKDTVTQDYVFEIMKEIRDLDVTDYKFVQEKSLNFCRQQELKKANEQISKIIDNGDFDNYEKCSEILKEALEVGSEKDDGILIADDFESVLDDDYRNPIPTGINGIDDLTDGGISKGELAVVLAPYGVGKSTILTKIANTAYNHGYNVLQIIFEDMPKVIQRKHASCWTGINLNDLGTNRESVIEEVRQRTNRSNQLVIKKFTSEGVTMNTIKSYLRHLLSTGVKVDMIVLDYIDCVESTKRFNDEWNSQGNVMRAFEAMLVEYDMVGWTAVQGSRCLGLDTKITISGKGIIDIKDVSEGDLILTNDGYKKVSKKFPIQKTPTYLIKTKSGKEIKVSGRHKFPTGDGRFKTIQSGLKPGDKLLVKK